MRMSSPCEELKPVRRTKQRMPSSGGLLASPSTFFLLLSGAVVWIRDVPLKRACILCLPKQSTIKSESVPAPIASFICGTDSPVSVASFTMALPLTMRQSQGTKVSFFSWFSVPGSAFFSSALVCREIKSPGRSSSMGLFSHFPHRKTKTLKLFVLIPRRVDMDFKRWKTVEASNIRMLPNVKQVYFHIVSITHRAAEKS
mmetsp:Transcript_77328/g.185246  ORF Transcript_77328/g.185246 Transcript_77328/m.185246 type:complete len:200 (-) Transcript_77328:590-1189(-)